MSPGGESPLGVGTLGLRVCLVVGVNTPQVEGRQGADISPPHTSGAGVGRGGGVPLGGGGREGGGLVGEGSLKAVV